jgi:hypothetical protein
VTHAWLSSLEGLSLHEAAIRVQYAGLNPYPVAETLDLPPYVGPGKVVLRHREDERRTVTGARAGDPFELEQ